MSSVDKRYPLICFLLILFATAFIVLFCSDALAVESVSKGRRLWNNIMIWVNFGILVFLFIKFAKKPLMGFLHGERDKIERKIGVIEDQVREARSLMEKEADNLKDMNRRIDEIREHILEIGQREKNKIIEKAEATASQMIEGAKKEADYKLEKAKKRFGEEMLETAVSIAVDRLKQGISPEDNEEIIDGFSTVLRAEKGLF